jgi:hypothetical protein
MTDNYFELTPEEALCVFSSTSEFVYQLRAYTDSDVFFILPPAAQELMLLALDRHMKLYEKVSLYLEKNGIPALKLFEYDTKVNKPKGGI